MTDEAMKPCPNPWCDDRCVQDVEHHEGGFFRVGCTCGVAGPANTSEAEAIRLWNTRTASVDELVEEIVEHLKQCVEASVSSKSDFNQGVTRGLEIAVAQIENRHYRSITRENIGEAS